MALAGRSSRRDGGRRLLVAGMILTVLIVFFDLSVKSRSPNTGPKASARSWVTKVLPIIQSSSTEGATFQRIRSVALSQVNGGSITNEANQAANQAKLDYQHLQAIKAPVEVAGPAGLLSAALLVRSQAAQLMATALSNAFKANADDLDTEVNSLSTAGQDFGVADRAYSLFAKGLPGATGVKAPKSVWLIHATSYQSGTLQPFLAGVVNAASGQPVDQVTIAQVSLTPSPLNTNGGVLVLLPTKVVNFSIVVANTGTVALNKMFVKATISPSAGNAQFSQRISLPPGAAYNYQGGPFNPKQGAVTTLTVTVIPPAGSSLQQTTKTVQFQATGPQSAPTSTSSPSTSSSSTTSTTTKSTRTSTTTKR